MPKYEYRILHMPTTSISVLNERVNNDAADGWSPILMSGNDHVNIMLRRPLADSDDDEK